MNTKRYLNQANVLNQRVQFLRMEIEKMRELSTSVSVKMDGERVQTSGDKDTMANAVTAILEKEDALAATIVLYMDSKETICKQINAMDESLYSNVLYARYIAGLPFEQISVIIGKKMRQTFNIHTAALEKFEKKYGNLYKKM